MFERFTDTARQVLILAQEEARAFHYGYVGTEHLVLGLLRGNGLAGQVLNGFGITLEDFRRDMAQGSAKQTTGQIPFSPSAKRALELAFRESLSLGHTFVRPEHLLLGIAREERGEAARVLRDFDASERKVREEVVRRLTLVGDSGPEVVTVPRIPFRRRLRNAWAALQGKSQVTPVQVRLDGRRLADEVEKNVRAQRGEAA